MHVIALDESLEVSYNVCPKSEFSCQIEVFLTNVAKAEQKIISGDAEELNITFKVGYFTHAMNNVMKLSLY